MTAKPVRATRTPSCVKRCEPCLVFTDQPWTEEDASACGAILAILAAGAYIGLLAALAAHDRWVWFALVLMAGYDAVLLSLCKASGSYRSPGDGQ